MSDEPRLIKSTSDASERAPQDNDVVSMSREKAASHLFDGAVPPATPLPTDTRRGRRLCVTALRQFCHECFSIGRTGIAGHNQEWVPDKSNAKVHVVKISATRRALSCPITAVGYML